MKKIVLTFTDDGTQPAHAATFDVSVQVDGREVECGELKGIVNDNRVVANPQLGWMAVVLRYLDHRLCSACPGSSSAKPPASSTPGSRRAASKAPRRY